MANERYWKLGGKETQHHLRNQKNISVESLFRAHRGPGPLELVLGVENGGASFVLVPESEARSFRQFGDREPMPATAFASLSPIWFKDQKSLESKLLTYSPRKSSNRSRGYLISKANPLCYFEDECKDIVTRPFFERNRTLYNVIHGKISPPRYSLRDNHLSTRIRFLSIAANKTLDKLLDIAWQSINFRSGKFVPDPVQYIRPQESRLLQLDGPPEKFMGEITQQLTMNQVKLSLNHALATQDRQGTTVLLTWDSKGVVRDIMHGVLGIDIAEWDSDLASLIGSDNRDGSVEGSEAQAMPPRRDSYHSVDVSSSRGGQPSPTSPNANPVEGANFRTTDPRRRPARSERSRSPRRDINAQLTDSYRMEGRSRIQSDAPLQNEALNSASTTDDSQTTRLRPVYVVDLHTMYTTLAKLQVGTRYNDFRKAASSELLALKESKGLSTSWCAGNECMLLFPMWESLFSGPAIDERAELILSSSPQVSTHSQASGSAVTQPSFNDLIGRGLPPARIPSKQTRGPYDNSDDSDF